MSDDLPSRADDYEERLLHAGSTEGIISGLVRGAQRSQQLIRWLAISLILDIAISIALGVLSLVAYENANQIQVKARSACIQSAQNSVVINSFLNLLISNAKISTVLTPSEIQQRVAGYRKRIIEIPDCPR